MVSRPNHTNGISITYTVRPERACPEPAEGSKGFVTFYDTINLESRNTTMKYSHERDHLVFVYQSLKGGDLAES